MDIAPEKRERKSELGKERKKKNARVGIRRERRATGRSKRCGVPEDESEN
jgi:hypothetical protein